MAKINVSLPDELLLEIDELANELNRSRSGLVAEASARYVAELQAEQAAERRRQDIAAARASAREIAKRVPAGKDTTEIIREDRDTNHGKDL